MLFMRAVFTALNISVSQLKMMQDCQASHIVYNIFSGDFHGLQHRSVASKRFALPLVGDWFGQFN